MENKITMKVAAYSLEPNSNGERLTEEAITNAVKNFNSIPIVDRSCARIVNGLDNYSIPNVTVIGVFNEAEYDKTTDEIIFNGRIFDAGISYTLDKDTGVMNFVEFSLLPPEIKGD